MSSIVNRGSGTFLFFLNKIDFKPKKHKIKQTKKLFYFKLKKKPYYCTKLYILGDHLYLFFLILNPVNFLVGL